MTDEERLDTEVGDLEPDLEPDLEEMQAAAVYAGDGEAPAVDEAFERLLQFMKESRAFDFTGYKRPSLTRRVWHRMRELDLTSFEEYQDRLQLDTDEFTALFNTILINVTSFFRDADAWDHLRTDVLPALLARADGGPVRIWSAGSSTGQEAYSMAMVLRDLMGERYRDRVKIYATDVDEEALARARQAVYTAPEVAGVPDAYRERFLEQTTDGFVIAPELRRSVIFGRNDLTRDAPISRIDVLLCRNTLMYFNAETQSRIVSRLGFALKRDGILFLGKAEMLLNHARVFDPLDLERRFFRRSRNDPDDQATLALPPRPPDRARPREDWALRNEVLLSNPVPQIAVDAAGRLALVNHRATELLGISERDLGRPFQDLEVSFRPTELRSQLITVAETRSPILLREVEWYRGGPEPAFVDIHLMPLFDPAGRTEGASISFTDVTGIRRLRVEVEEANRQLERAYEELQSTNEELETTNEELQSTVEELETTNEELQSTNEELETMNEELQSSNDQLQSTNDQLRERTDEVTELNAFMASILGSLDAAVVVVNSRLVVQVWTDQAQELWGLRAEETVGRRLLDLDSGLPVAELESHLHKVITGGEHVVGAVLQAVDRRGRPVTLRLAVTALQTVGASPSGALIMMTELVAAAP